MVITLCELRLAEVKDHGQRLTREWQMRKSNLRLPSPKLHCPSKVYATELHCAQLHPAGTCLLHRPSLLLRHMHSLGFLLGCPDSVPRQGWREGKRCGVKTYPRLHTACLLRHFWACSLIPEYSNSGRGITNPETLRDDTSVSHMTTRCEREIAPDALQNYGKKIVIKGHTQNCYLSYKLY